jgi:hypothetical protein
MRNVCWLRKIGQNIVGGITEIVWQFAISIRNWTNDIAIDSNVKIKNAFIGLFPRIAI